MLNSLFVSSKFNKLKRPLRTPSPNYHAFFFQGNIKIVVICIIHGVTGFLKNLSRISLTTHLYEINGNIV